MLRTAGCSLGSPRCCSNDRANQHSCRLTHEPDNLKVELADRRQRCPNRDEADDGDEAAVQGLDLEYGRDKQDGHGLESL